MFVSARHWNLEGICSICSVNLIYSINCPAAWNCADLSTISFPFDTLVGGSAFDSCLAPTAAQIRIREEYFQRFGKEVRSAILRDVRQAYSQLAVLLCNEIIFKFFCIFNA